MRIDHGYLKKLLEAFEDAPNPVIDIRELEAVGLSYEDDLFVLHMEILADQDLIRRADQKPGFGLMRGADGHLAWSVVPLRLTAAGHDFIEALRNKEVWATIKRDFRDASISTLVDVAKKLAEGYARKKIEALLKGDLPT